jgi:2-polyprenyl-3-methyl-5-hydroxy-6-metoxy-1,4-benzoquinol methylase
MPDLLIIRFTRILCDPTRLLKRILSVARRIAGRDITNKGERVDIVYNGQVDFDRLDIYQKSHYKRYVFACGLIDKNAVVGDMACGTGYGTAMMSYHARQAYGYDISPVIEEVKKRYRSVRNLEFIQGDILQIKTESQFDTIVSFETVEHFPSALVPDLLRKFNLMLKEGGRLILSTPFNQEETDATRVYHRSFGITEEILTEWLRTGGFSVEEYYSQNYETHEIRNAIDPRDFIIAVCVKRRIL